MQEQDQYITLRDYINVVLKHKKTILCIFFTTVVLAAIVAFLLPKTYEVSMIFQPGQLSVGEDYIDSPKNIESKIKTGAFNSVITDKLDLKAKKVKLGFKVFQPHDTNLIKVSMAKKQKKTAVGLEILNVLADELSNFYRQEIEYRNKAIQGEIDVKNNDILSIGNDIDMRKKNIIILDTRESALADKIKDVEANTKDLLEERTALLNSSGKADDISSLLYTSTIQQNIEYLDTLQNEISDAKMEKEKIVSVIQSLEIKINNVKQEIVKLNLDKSNVSGIRVVQKPTISELPIAPNKRVIIALAGFLSLTLAVFMVFFKEYMQQAPQKPI